MRIWIVGMLAATCGAGLARAQTDSGAGDPVAIAQGEAARGWSARTVRTGEAVVFPFGRVQPTLTCAPLRACVIQLEPGERVLGKASGDTERWLIDQTATGAGGRTPLIVIKPTACDLATNLVVTTDRRVYDVTLDAAPCRGRAGGAAAEYTRVIRFYYPNELMVRLATADGSATLATEPIGQARPAQLNFRYLVRADRHVLWAPVHVYDDGAHVYIRLPESTRHGALPVLFQLSEDGARSVLNYAVEGDAYVTDRVFARAVLVVGDGKKEQVAELVNQQLTAAR